MASALARPPVPVADLVDRLAAVPGREGRLTHLEVLPAAGRPDRRLAGLGRARTWSPRSPPAAWRALGAPGGGRRGRARRAARRARHRHRLGQVAGLPAARALGGPRGPGRARAARRHRALPRADQGAGPGPAGRARARSASTCGSPPTTATAAASSATGPATTPSTSSPTPTCCTARCCPGTQRWAPFLGLAVLRRGRRVPPLPRRLRRPRRPRAAPAAPGLRVVRRAPDVRARLGHRRRARGRRAPADRARRPGGHRRRLAARRGGAGAVGAAASPRTPARTARRCAGPPRRRPPTCWPTWSPRTSAPWPSSGRAAAPSRWR